MYGFGGRGAFYMLVGGLVASHEPWIETLLHVCGSLILIVGFSYILFQIARSLGVPTSMTPPRKPNFFEEGSEPLWNADRYEEVPDVEVGSSPEVAGK
ncbi:hypothetical protein FRC03_009408 [Tulasnella sp. 419]|nr:hypothetical protein FRC03_009408 [Tulasnella sp. 419]